MPGFNAPSDVYVLKSTWTTANGEQQSSQGTHGYPSLEHAKHGMTFDNLEVIPDNYVTTIELAPPGTPLLDIVWENFLKS